MKRDGVLPNKNSGRYGYHFIDLFWEIGARLFKAAIIAVAIAMGKQTLSWLISPALGSCIGCHLTLQTWQLSACVVVMNEKKLQQF